MNQKDLLRALPKIDKLMDHKEYIDLLEKYPYQIVKECLSETIDNKRQEILNGQLTETNLLAIYNDTKYYCEKVCGYSLKRIINATGTVLHTNMGRSLLSKKAKKHLLMAIDNYTNLEYDIKKGERGSRYIHAVELIKRITGAEDAVVVNNNAGAVFLTLNSLARNKETIVSRGELVEVGGSFRIPSIMEQSLTILKEVGATNKTHLEDYYAEINEDTAIIMKVHTSNFKIVGFHEECSVVELKEIAGDIPIIEDLGSGTLIDLTPFGLSYERTVIDCIKEGTDVVTFSGDKILGGPQAGIIVGKKEYIERIKKNQLLRAFRVDKLTLASLEATLQSYLDLEKSITEIPTLMMLTESYEYLVQRAEQLKNCILNKIEMKITLEDSYSQVGGGSYPADLLKSKALVFHRNDTVQFEKYLRNSKAHIVGKIRENCFIMDIRTIFEKDYDVIAETMKAYEGEK